MLIIVILISIAMLLFASISLIKETIKKSKSKRRIFIDTLLIIEAFALIIGFLFISRKPKKIELLYWSFFLMPIILIIWLALIDLKENLFNIQKRTAEELENLIKEIKKEQNKENQEIKN